MAGLHTAGPFLSKLISPALPILAFVHPNEASLRGS